MILVTHSMTLGDDHDVMTKAIACNLTLPKPKFSRVSQAEDNIRFHRFLYELEMTWFYQPLPSGTLEYISTLTLP